MAGPVLPDNPVMRWVNQSPSVMENPVLRGLRKAAQIIGVADPDQVMGVAGASVGPKAIPLDQPGRYGRSAAINSLIDLVQEARVTPSGGPMVPTLERALKNPIGIRGMMATELKPEKASEAFRTLDDETWLKTLTDIFYPGR